MLWTGHSGIITGEIVVIIYYEETLYKVEETSFKWTCVFNIGKAYLKEGKSLVGGMEAVEETWGSLNIMEKLLLGEKYNFFWDKRNDRDINVEVC